MSESFLADAGSLFFAAWILVVAAVSIVAFGHDVFPAKAHINVAREIGEDPSSGGLRKNS